MSNQARHAALQRIALRALKAARGESVTYWAGSYSVELTAVKSRPISSQVDTADAIVIESTSWDWILDPAELVDANLEPLEPERGDKIISADGTVYRLVPGNSGDATVWRWSDSLKTWRRAHSAEE